MISLAEARKLKGSVRWNHIPQKYKRGIKAEDDLKKFANRKGWAVKSATESEDIYDHIDYYIQKGGVVYSVDVKAKKKCVVCRRVSHIPELNAMEATFPYINDCLVGRKMLLLLRQGKANL